MYWCAVQEEEEQQSITAPNDKNVQLTAQSKDEVRVWSPQFQVGLSNSAEFY